jgi:hypothetical protein
MNSGGAPETGLPNGGGDALNQSFYGQGLTSATDIDHRAINKSGRKPYLSMIPSHECRV